MSSLSTEAFPYTMAYVCELLNTDESRVTALCNTLGIQPHRNERTGHMFFGLKDLEQLQSAMENGDISSDSPSQLPQRSQTAIASSKNTYSSVPQRSTGSSLSRTELSAIVESVSNAKEEILKDLSQLLDDKLSGLDEVVVELIRSKSENDSLREELKRIEENKTHLESELSKFKPAAFGFYRKDT
jgi:hypothetical protein